MRQQGRLACADRAEPACGAADRVVRHSRSSGLAGPESIEPGGTGQFTATAHYSDGSSQDRSNEASWRTSDESVLAISTAGTAVARARGETSVNASFGGRNSTKPDVLVLPSGTYRLRGAVRDAGLPVDGARVTVTENPAEGLTAVSRNGEYRLYGVAGVADIVVTADGYVPIEHRVNVTGHQTVNFVVIPERPREKAAGTYTLRMTAAESCQATLPSSFLARTYTAVVAQNGRRLIVELRDADFFRTYLSSQLANIFTGRADPDALRFWTREANSYYYDYFPTVVEVVSATAWFSFVGSITMTPSLHGFAGTLDGDVVMYGDRFWSQARCYSNSHRVEFIEQR